MASGYHPATTVRDILTEEPDANRQKLKRMVALRYKAESDIELRENLRSLPVQGSLIEEEVTINDKTWATAVKSLSDRVMKFALNAVSDTLPHRANLKKWKKIPSDSCPLCNERQTLCHVLNNCQKALELRRYTVRHDAVLRLIFNSIQNNLPETFKVTADLSEENYRFPEYICSSDDLRPDIVIWSDIKKEVWLIELTVCFDTNAAQADARQRERYATLKEDIQANKYSCVVCPIQVGSRGYIDTDSFSPLISFLKLQLRQYTSFLTSIASISLTESYGIWKSRNNVIIN